jgi:hypothetical protein
MNTFASLCDGKYYIIPPNQRGFSWGSHEVEAIFSDLQLAGNHAHYLGPIIVTRTDAPDFQDESFKTTAEYCLEDGQQRLTSFFLIVNELRKRIEEVNGGPDIESSELHRLVFFKHGSLRLRLKNSNQDLDQFFSFIMTGAPAPPARKTPPMVAMEACKCRISRMMAGFLLPSLLAWKNRIVNQAKFIWVDLASEGVNRYLTFDAINSRGLPLSEFDKIKNFCMLIDSIRGLHLPAEHGWYKAITHLEEFGVSSRKDESTFISEAFAIFFNQRVGQDQVHAKFVERFSALLTGSSAALEAQLASFIDLWEPLAKSFGFIATKRRSPHYGTLCTQGAAAWLDRLDNMELPGVTRVLLTVCHRNFSRQDFESVVRACEIFTFRFYAVMGNRKDRYAAHILNMAHEVLTQGKLLSDVIQRICLWLKVHAPLSKVVDELASGRAKYYHDPDVRGWAYCYYFLYEYELANSPTGVSPIPWESSGRGRENTQEHILPQSHRDGGWWQTAWPIEAEAERCKHRLGNLTLTSNNSALGRKPIALKLNDPAASHWYSHPNATNSEKKIASFTDGHQWESANILAREIDMLTFAVHRWAIPCCADNGDILLPKEFEDCDQKKIVIDVVNCIDCASEESQEEESEACAAEDLQGEPPTI